MWNTSTLFDFEEEKRTYCICELTLSRALYIQNIYVNGIHSSNFIFLV